MIRLLNAPLVVQRGVALGILATVLTLLLGSASAVHFALADKRASIIDKRMLLGRLNAVEARFGALPSAGEALAGDDLRLFLTGPSEAVVRATLQQDFNEMAARSGADVTSVGNAPDLNKTGVVYVGIQANVAAETGELLKLLSSLEITSPVLFIPKLVIRSTDPRQVSATAGEIPLSVQIQVYGALEPGLRAGEDGSLLQ
ncbi:type II secretion system protein GspM [Oricola sp.]|uniref:type II secretion system protein GspM n=1 Tax=Oricola sp. TaxID=1979950 RepID=UPI0025D5EE43|nr:type II secretion system protein GspM [Oricola sp.]MCI5075342.1 type II secretion system protein GspM [Oricola sp.]